MYGCIDESFKKSAKISDLRYCNTNTYFICQERTTDGFDPSIGRIGSGGPGPDAPPGMSRRTSRRGADFA